MTMACAHTYVHMYDDAYITNYVANHHGFTAPLDDDATADRAAAAITTSKQTNLTHTSRPGVQQKGR